MSVKGDNAPNILTTLNLQSLASTLIDRSDYNTIFVANTFETYKKYADTLKVNNFELYNLNCNNGENTLILAPNPNIDFKNYENVVFLDMPVCDSYIKSLKCKNVYVPSRDYNFNAFSMLDCKRTTFGECHNAIKNTLKKRADYDELYELYLVTKKDNPQISKISYVQFAFVYMVLTELGILTINDNVYHYNNIAKTSLDNSKIYNMISVIANK